jgi:hypothetical protein
MPTEVKGVIKARKVLKSFNPDLLKEIQKEMRDALKPIVAQAKGFIPTASPLRGWQKTERFWSYDSAEMRRGITYSIAPSRANDQGFKSLAQIINKSPMGAIWESARNPQEWVGPKTSSGKTRLSKNQSRSNNPNAGSQFIAGLGPGVQSSQGYGRGIRKAWAKDEGKANAAILKAVDKLIRLAEGKING